MTLTTQVVNIIQYYTIWCTVQKILKTHKLVNYK